MPCRADFFMTKDGSICHIYKKYIESGTGGDSYHGELCKGCMWWEDSPEDILTKKGHGSLVKTRSKAEEEFDRDNYQQSY